MCYAERITLPLLTIRERKEKRGGAGGGWVREGGQAIISNSVRSNGSHVRLIIIESGKRGCLIEVSRALRGLGDAD